MDFEHFMRLIELSHNTHGTDWTYNRRLLRLRLRELIASEIKNCNLQNVTNCNFKTVIVLYEDVNSILATSEQILPIHKGDKLTINDKYYSVDYVDYIFDKAIFEVVVTDDN